MKIFKYKDRWATVIEIPREKGEPRKQKWVYGKTREEVKQKATVIEYQLQSNTYTDDENTTLKVYLEKWFKNHSANLEPYTIEGYSINIYKHIIPALGDTRLKDLTPMKIQTFYKQKLENGRIDGKGGLSAKSVLYIHRNLKQALSDAVKMNLINKNPADAITPPKVKKAKINVLSEPDVVSLLEFCKGDLLEIAIHLAVGLGMRREEILGLKWDNVDLKNNILSVKEVLIYTKEDGLLFKTPKSFDSIRDINIPEELSEILKQHKIKQEENDEFFGDNYTNNNLVVCQDNGDIITPDSLSKRFKNLIDKFIESGGKKTTFHGLRHANATLHLKYNTNIKVVSAVLGHSTTAITQDIYQSALDDVKKEAAEKINNGIYKKVRHDDKGNNKN